MAGRGTPSRGVQVSISKHYHRVSWGGVAIARGAHFYNAEGVTGRGTSASQYIHTS